MISKQDNALIIIKKIFVSYFNKFKKIIFPFYIWEGVYKHYKDVPITKENLSGKKWINVLKKETLLLLQEVKKNKILPSNVQDEQSLLPLLSCIILYNNTKNNINILDLGGGLGSDYIYLKNSLGKNFPVYYYIVESKLMCRVGRELFVKDKNIKYLESLQRLTNIDIVHLDSTLQYIENYGNLLKKLCVYRSNYFLFTRLIAGEIPTYATAQVNIRNLRLASWFFNVEEIIKIMNDNGYCLIFKSVCKEKWNRNNVPKTYRLDYSCNLLFKRKEK